jgi:hypothetical protein
MGFPPIQTPNQQGVSMGPGIPGPLQAQMAASLQNVPPNQGIIPPPRPMSGIPPMGLPSAMPGGIPLLPNVGQVPPPMPIGTEMLSQFQGQSAPRLRPSQVPLALYSMYPMMPGPPGPPPPARQPPGPHPSPQKKREPKSAHKHASIPQTPLQPPPLPPIPAPAPSVMAPLVLGARQADLQP